jgi:AraC-like DNA-binding protein
LCQAESNVYIFIALPHLFHYFCQYRQTNNMENLEKYVIGLAGRAKKLTYPQLVLGHERHPAKMKQTAAPLPFMQVFDETDNFFEVACVKAGKCIITLNRRSYLLREGDICLVNHGVKHYETYAQEKTGYEMVWLSHRHIGELLVNNSLYHPAGGYAFSSHLILKIKPSAAQLLEDIFRVPEPRQEFRAIREKLAGWFDAVAENVRQGNYTKRVNTDKSRYETALKAKKIGPAVEHVKKHFREKLTLADIAGQVALSPSHFCVLFKEVYEMSLFEFVSTIRLKEAARLLRDTELHINEISARVGYEDPYFFSRIFKRWFGLSPVHFRERVFPRLFITDPLL